MPPLLSQHIRQQRYGITLPFVAHSILDIGCGHAFLADLLPQQITYVGIDINPALLEYARRQHPQHQFYQIDLEHEPLPEAIIDQRFETITMFALLEHLARPQETLNRLAGLLAPGGRLLATTPSPLGHRIHRLGAAAGLFYREAAEDHKSILGKNALQRLCEQAGLRMLHYRTFQLGCNQLIVATPCG